MLSVDRVEEIIITLLAPKMGLTVPSLRKRMEEGQVPVDSLLAAEILIDLEEHAGLVLPNDWLTKRSLQSIHELAKRTLDVGKPSKSHEIGA